MHANLSIYEALRFGYETTRTHFRALIGIMLALFAIQVVVALSVEDHMFLQFIAQVFVVPGITLAGLSLFFHVADGQAPTFTHLTERFAHYGNFVGTNILYTLAIFLGFILLIIPGVYLSIRLMYALTVVAEKDLSPMEAFRISGILTKGLIWKLIGFNIVLGLVNLCGVLLLGVGLLFTVPMTTLALLFVYKKLSLERLILSAPAVPQPMND